MFASEIWFTSPADLLGLLVTVVGIWFVVKQLNETRLASQMEGLLQLQMIYKEVYLDKNIMYEFMDKHKWSTLSDSEAYKLAAKTKSIDESWANILNFYDTLGLLVKSKALDYGIARDSYAGAVVKWWGFLGPVIEQDREDTGEIFLAENWEWLAKEFE